MRKNQITAGLLVFSLMSTTVFAAAGCPDPATQCPSLGSALKDAKTCGWSVKDISPYDPLTQYVLFSNPIGPGPVIKNGISTCIYAASLDTNPLPGYLIHAVSGGKLSQ